MGHRHFDAVEIARTAAERRGAVKLGDLGKLLRRGLTGRLLRDLGENSTRR